MTGEEIQVENGDYTRIHNEILEQLAKMNLSGQEMRAVIFLLRKTYGWHKKEDAISLSQWADGLGIAHPFKIVRIIKSLIAKKIIYQNGKSGLTSIYGFNKYFEEWCTSTQDGTTNETSTPQGTEPVPSRVLEPVPSRVLTKDNKDNKKDNAGKKRPQREPKPPRQPTVEEQKLRTLASHFSEKTAIPEPILKSKSDFSGYAVQWKNPLKQVLEYTCWDLAAAIELLDTAIDEARSLGKPPSYPKSIIWRVNIVHSRNNTVPDSGYTRA